MISLADLVAELKTIVPIGGLLAQYKEVLSITSNGQAKTLTYPPYIGSVTVQTSGGEDIKATDYTVNYVNNTVTLDGADYPAPISVIVTYKHEVAEDYIKKAVRDLGQRLPQRGIATVTIGTNGIGTLPDTFQNLISYDSPITDIEDNCTVTNGAQSPCNLFVRGDSIVANPAPDAAYDVDICYWCGFPLISGNYQGLTKELADIAMLKAIAITYRSPQMTEAAVNAGSATSTNTNGGDLVELTYEIEDQRTVQRWEGAGKSFYDRAKAIKSVASDYEMQYEAKVSAVQGVTKVGFRRGGYRDQHWRLAG